MTAVFMLWLRTMRHSTIENNEGWSNTRSYIMTAGGNVYEGPSGAEGAS